ncbi:hypothetical protein BXZ70DRAFT_931921 [Cristinia sonorae]|uniref:F-box domain-containing protein n=1 Tax=Cristinia sonorae TaxID=1940300 RepID=A0A8K0XQT2_9AGAR|nr:hypothetical protein BXZ70DRAFT_931921 [Cristinia sonorae]
MLKAIDAPNLGQLSSTASSYSQIPTEVWETVVDWIVDDMWSKYIDRPARKQLASCSLVCRSWTPRSRFHLSRHLELTSESGLACVTQRLKETPGLADRVETLEIHCTKGGDQHWVSLAPLHLPRMEYLKNLTLVGFDFTKKHPHIYEAYRQLKTDQLYLLHPTYSRFSQVTQLGLVTRTQLFHVGPRVGLPSIMSSLETGPLVIGGSHLSEIHLSLTWHELSVASLNWLLRRGSIRSIRLRLQEEMEGKAWGSELAVWTRIAVLFRSLCAQSPSGQLDVVLASRSEHKRIFHMFTVKDITDRPVKERTMLFHPNPPSELIPHILHGVRVSLCRLNRVLLPAMTKPVDSQIWQAIDDKISYVGFHDLDECSIYYDPHDSMTGYHVGHHGCLHEAYRQWMPRTAARGFLRCSDGPECCALR